MAAMRLGDAGDQRPQRRLGEPFRNPPPQDAIAQGPLAGNDQNPAQSARGGVFQEGAERRVGACLAETVKIDMRAGHLESQRHAPVAAGFDRRRRRLSHGSSRERFRMGS